MEAREANIKKKAAEKDEQKQKKEKDREEAKLLVSLAEARVCASCHEFPGGENWKGCEECDLWFCDICWELEAEDDSRCFYCIEAQR